jgi:hypothetical protein
MSTPVTINTAAVQYASGTTECHCVETVTGVTGTTTVSFVVVVDSATLAEDWTDAQLCAAVAQKLGIPAADVSVASAPEGTISVDAPVIEDAP